MSRIAVIGAGISGMAAAYYLSEKHEVWLFEREHRLGGHTHTHTVDGLEIDTGFIVHNDETYPNFIRLMGELGVARQDSDMSLSVFELQGGYAYSSNGLRGFFSSWRNLLNPSHYQMGMDILRFNKEAPKLLGQKEEITLGEYLDREKYCQAFQKLYIVPMASAIWSSSPEDILDFPAFTLIRFFMNHNLLSVNQHHSWKALVGGSSTYIPPLTARYRERIVLGARIASVDGGAAGAQIRLESGNVLNFDECVLACHGDQALCLLDTPTEKEVEVLSNFKTSRNEACLHTDEHLLPRQLAARASWNCILGTGGGAALTYSMNRLQRLKTDKEYCVTLNCTNQIDPQKIVRRIEYRHPLYTKDAVASQSRWAEINGRRHIHFCGAYWFYGFHEDGVNSALRVAKQLGIDC